MKRWLIGLVVMAPAGCGGDDPQGPPQVQTVQAVVTVDWPLAREPGFVDASFEIIEFNFDVATIASGTIPPSGLTETRFLAECGPSGPQTFVVHFSGHFLGYEDDPRAIEEEAGCGMFDAIVFRDCDDPFYTTEPVEPGEPRWQCQPPPAE